VSSVRGGVIIGFVGMLTNVDGRFGGRSRPAFAITTAT
jgi:hypothetical protein